MSVTVDNGSLFVDDKEFVVKGFVYSPYLIGQQPGDGFPSEKVVELDFKLMRIVNANTIRVFSAELKNMPQYVYDLAEKIKEAYFKEDLRKKYGKESRYFSLKYNWDDIVTDNWVPLLNSLMDDKALDDRRLV